MTKETKFDDELLGVEAALRRAGLKAKQEAERLGTPYVVHEKDSVAEASVSQQQKGKQSMKTIFELVKVVLDELYEETKKMHASEVATDKAIIDKMNYLSKKYTQLTDKSSTVIDYKDSATRFAYVYKYVASHADYLNQILRALINDKDKALKEVFMQESLRVSCIGGGPGSDIVGMLKYLLSLDKQNNRVICYLCDQEQAWADSWTEIGEQMSSESFSLNTNFQQLDVTNSESWKYQKKFLDADIFTLSYFVSEVSRFDAKDVNEFWDTLFSKAKKGSVFIFVDNAHTNFTSYFDEKWKAHNIKAVASGDAKVTPSSNEQLSVFGIYLKKFPDNIPKLKSQISYRILIKE